MVFKEQNITKPLVDVYAENFRKLKIASRKTRNGITMRNRNQSHANINLGLILNTVEFIDGLKLHHPKHEIGC